jgi:hypothetical protein
MATQKRNSKHAARQEAADSTASPEKLRELADKSDELARIVAMNPSVPLDLMRLLSRSEDDETCKCVINNPFAPFDILSDLDRRFPGEFVNNPNRHIAFYNGIKP